MNFAVDAHTVLLKVAAALCTMRSSATRRGFGGRLKPGFAPFVCNHRFLLPTGGSRRKTLEIAAGSFFDEEIGKNLARASLHNLREGSGIQRRLWPDIDRASSPASGPVHEVRRGID